MKRMKNVYTSRCVVLKHTLFLFFLGMLSHLGRHRIHACLNLGNNYPKNNTLVMYLVVIISTIFELYNPIKSRIQ